MEDDVIIKLLSEDPSNYEDAPLEGIRRLMSKFLKKEIPRGEPLDTSTIESMRAVSYNSSHIHFDTSHQR